MVEGRLLKIVGKSPNGFPLLAANGGVAVIDVATGEPIANVKSVTIRAEVGEIVTAVIEFYPSAIELDGVLEVEDPNHPLHIPKDQPIQIRME